jgi:predicted ArsR family transcriptional regulator
MNAPIGLLGDTKRHILEQLQQGPATAQALAEKFGFQVSAIRQHLDALEAAGLVKPRFRRAGVGRPRKVYELTDAGREVFPRRYHLLLNRLLERLAEREGRAYTARLLAEVAEELATEAKVPVHGTLQERALALAQALNTLGFEATLEQTANGVVLVRKNCIFLDAAKEHHDLMCQRFDQSLVRATFGGETELESCMVTGGCECRNVLLPDAPVAASAPKDG